jgi:hypothetical protein
MKKTAKKAGRKAKRVRNRKGGLPRHPRAGSVAKGRKRVIDMYVFLATGEAKAKNDFGCREGDLHSLLVFSRQPAGTPDEKLARKGAAFAGWRRVKFERARKLEAAPAEQTLRAAYDDAIELGCSVVADRRALTPARRPGKRDRRGKERKA